MDGRLKMASQSGDIDFLYTLIKEDGELLDHITRLPFVDTPLHIAASEGHVQFAMEIMRLQPSFSRKPNQDGFSPMHLALQSGKTSMVIRLLDADKSLVRVQGREGVTPLHYVAKEGYMELLYVFLSACPESVEDVTIRNETPLHIALKNDKIEAFEVLLRWLSQVSYQEVHQLEKKMLNWEDDDSNTLLHIATLRNQPEAVMLLLTSQVDVNSKNLAGRTPLDIIHHEQPISDRRIGDMLCAAGALEGSSLPYVRTFTYYKSTNQRLKQAAQEGDIGGLYALIKEDSSILESINLVPFVNTPLHIAASAGHTDFAMEMMRLKPEFARKQNPEGFSALHLALKQGKTHTLLFLLSVCRDLVRVKGRDGKTLLHYAAEIGNMDLLANFLAASPESIIDLTIRKETALHLAAKNDKLEALEVLLGWLQHVDLDMILQRTDDEGNTVLHIATLRNQFQAVRLLIKRVDMNVKNSEGLTAMDIADRHGSVYNDTDIRKLVLQRGALGASSLPERPTLADSLKKEMSLLERWVLGSYLTKSCMSNENRNSLLVVAVLIATATFQAVLSPPAGMQRDYFTSFPHKTSSAASNSTGEPNVPSNFGFHSLVAWNCFLALNTMTFLTSVSEIWFHLPRGFYFLMKLVLPLLVCYMISLSLSTPVPSLMPFFFILILLSQLKSIVRNLFFKRSLDVKISLMKYCPNLHREIKV
ncbi:ankyrin repeat-containing protein BDA1-like [Argentina anserina]|uniref:ankyrin repeat-containing protein BDA1-like n=1 Tax=Argentina anserina TaxID=57926 RepID=UPI0021761D77|nr:ankyrin repeat-containing protein BDA1-like [Potentilla anserina]